MVDNWVKIGGPKVRWKTFISRIATVSLLPPSGWMLLQRNHFTPILSSNWISKNLQRSLALKRTFRISLCLINLSKFSDNRNSSPPSLEPSKTYSEKNIPIFSIQTSIQKNMENVTKINNKKCLKIYNNEKRFEIWAPNYTLNEGGRMKLFFFSMTKKHFVATRKAF